MLSVNTSTVFYSLACIVVEAMLGTIWVCTGSIYRARHRHSLILVHPHLKYNSIIIILYRHAHTYMYTYIYIPCTYLIF